MRRGSLLILLVAALMGLAAAFMARTWIQQQASARPSPDAVQNTIVVAAAPLTRGTEITAKHLVEIPWAAQRVPEGAFSTREHLLRDGRRVVRARIERNEPIFDSKVTKPGQRATLSEELDEGYRAVTVRVDDVRGVAGFVLPGDQVDVVLIGSGGGGSYSDILVQNVYVLAVDQVAGERETPTVAKAVTLRVTTEQAQQILLASSVGRLSLILRQGGAASEPTRRITEADLGGRQQPAPEPQAAPAPEPQASRETVVHVIRGTASKRYNVHRLEEETETEIEADAEAETKTN